MEPNYFASDPSAPLSYTLNETVTLKMIKSKGAVGFLIVLALVLVFSPVYHFGTKTTVKYQVKEKQAVGGENSKYLVYTEDGRVFRNSDSVWELKWNSSNVYAELEAGNCYRSEAWGLRIPFLSSYQNIDQANEVGC